MITGVALVTGVSNTDVRRPTSRPPLARVRDSYRRTRTLLERIEWVLATKRVKNQAEWVQAAGLSRSALAVTLSRLRKGDDVQIKSETAIALARAAKVDVGWFLSGDGSPEGAPSPERGNYPMRDRVLERFATQYPKRAVDAVAAMHFAGAEKFTELDWVDELHKATKKHEKRVGVRELDD